MKMKNIVAMTMAATMVWNGTAAFGARDVTNNLNMYVTQMQDENTGIVVQPNMAVSSVRPTEKLTKQSAAVNVQKGWLVYDATPFEAECFLLDNRFYFKLISRKPVISAGIFLWYGWQQKRQIKASKNPIRIPIMVWKFPGMRKIGLCMWIG